MASLIQSVGGYLTANEVRDKLGMAPIDDEELGESYVTPEDEQSDDPGGDGLFGSDGRDTGFRHLQTPEGVPDNAQGPVKDKSEIPDGAQTFEGPQGGTYFVPSGEDADVQQSPEQIQQEVSELVESGNQVQLENFVSDNVGASEVVIPKDIDDEQKTRMVSTLAHAGQSGMTEQIDEVRTTRGGGEAFFDPQDRALNINPDVNERDMEGWRDEGVAAGDDAEWLMLHEIGHAEVLDELSIDQIAEYQEQPLSVAPDGDFPVLENMELVEDEVGEYATTSVSEFLAETYAGLAQGQDYSDELMELYEGYGGPDSWQDYRGGQQ
jgi:hypothetical protein